MTKKNLIYDIPTRLFHWIFSIGFLASFLIAKVVDDDSSVFSYHMLIGITLVFVVVSRFIWGLFGSKHSRFASFPLKPIELIEYFKSILAGNKKRWAGHNPASSWAALMMMLLTIGLGLTGYLMTNGVNKHFFEEVHEIFANSFIVLVIFHIAGIALHTVRHNETIGLSMIHGQKEGISDTEQIHTSHSMVGLLFLCMVVLVAFNLFKNFNPQTGELKVAGSIWQLGESEDNDSKVQHESDREAQDKDEPQDNDEDEED